MVSIVNLVSVDCLVDKWLGRADVISAIDSRSTAEILIDTAVAVVVCIVTNIRFRADAAFTCSPGPIT